MLTNRSRTNLDNKIRKKKLEQKGEISCGLCPYNKKENANYHRPRPDRHKNVRRASIRFMKPEEE